MTAFTTTALQALTRTILARAAEYDWRVHGIGMLQLYLPNDCRLHVWDVRLRVPGVALPHTHAWSFHSAVVAGVVQQWRYRTVPTALTAGAIAYRGAKIVPGADPDPREERQVWLVRSPEEVIPSGRSYHQLRSEIHVSDPRDGTVTLVERRDRSPEDAAYVYWPEGLQFVSAAPRAATADEVKQVIGRALEKWF